MGKEQNGLMGGRPRESPRTSSIVDHQAVRDDNDNINNDDDDTEAACAGGRDPLSVGLVTLVDLCTDSTSSWVCTLSVAEHPHPNGHGASIFIRAFNGGKANNEKEEEKEQQKQGAKANVRRTTAAAP